MAAHATAPYGLVVGVGVAVGVAVGVPVGVGVSVGLGEPVGEGEVALGEGVGDDDVALGVGVGEDVVGLGDAVGRFAGAVNCCTGDPLRAAPMKAVQTRVGNEPPVTEFIPPTPESVIGLPLASSFTNITAAARSGV